MSSIREQVASFIEESIENFGKNKKNMKLLIHDKFKIPLDFHSTIEGDDFNMACEGTNSVSLFNRENNIMTYYKVVEGKFVEESSEDVTK